MPKRQSNTISPLNSSHKKLCTPKAKGSTADVSNPYINFWPDEPTLPGRREHLERMRKVLEDGLEKLEGKTVYCYGQPGTGKTLSVNVVARQFCDEHDIPLVEINCIKAMATSGYEAVRRIHTSLLDALGKKRTRVSDASLEAVSRLVKSLSEPVVLVLDEVDALNVELNGQNLLAQIWSIPSRGPLIILSIANTLDLCVRLKKYVAARIIKLRFLPYSPQQCHDILSCRTKQVGKDLSGFCPKALEVLVKTVMNQEGDLRRVLDMCDQLSRAEGQVKMGEVLDICSTTLRNTFVNDVEASIKGLPFIRKLALYGFCQGSQKDLREGEAYVVMDVDEVLSRFETNKAKLLADEPKLAYGVPRGTLSRKEAMYILKDLSDACLIEQKKAIGRKVKPGKEVYRLQFEVDKVRTILRKELLGNYLCEKSENISNKN